MNTTTYNFMIPTENEHIMDAKLKKINTRCKRLKAQELQITKGELVWDAEDEIMYMPYEVTGEIAYIDGFKIIAKIEYNGNNGSLIFIVDNEEKLPAKYDGTFNDCEHCETNRSNRKYLYIVKNTETGEHLQLGRSCATNYFQRDVSWELGMCEIQVSLGELDELQEPHERNFASAKNYTNIKDFMCATKRIISEDGRYINANTAEWERVNSTRHKADRLHSSTAFKATDEEMEYIDNLISWVIGMEVDVNENNYLYNCQVIINRGVALEREQGFLCGLLPYYYVAMKKVEEAQKQEEETAKINNSYLDVEVGDKVDFKNVTLQERFSFETMYGTSTCYKFLSSSNNVLVTFSTGAKLDVLKVGDVLDIKATVKGFDEYRGVKQTVLKLVKKI